MSQTAKTIALFTRLSVRIIMEFADQDYPGSPTNKEIAMKKWIAFTIVPAIIIASQAWAGNYDGHFGDMDTSGDDQVTWEEFHAHFPDADQADYTAMDANGDGTLDHDEWHAYKKSMGIGHGHGKE
jgi:hypothetical protein